MVQPGGNNMLFIVTCNKINHINELSLIIILFLHTNVYLFYIYEMLFFLISQNEIKIHGCSLFLHYSSLLFYCFFYIHVHVRVYIYIYFLINTIYIHAFNLFINLLNHLSGTPQIICCFIYIHVCIYIYFF